MERIVILMLVTWLLTCLTCDLMLHLHYNHFHIIPWMLLPTLVWMGKFSIFVFLNHQSEMVMRVSVSATISKYHVVQVYRQLMIWKIWEWRLWELEQGFNLSCFNLFIIFLILLFSDQTQMLFKFFIHVLAMNEMVKWSSDYDCSQSCHQGGWHAYGLHNIALQ